MNTRNSSRGLGSSGARGRSQRSLSSSRNNISIELQDSVSGSRPKVVHSPAKTPAPKTKPTEGLNILRSPTRDIPIANLGERTQSSSSLPVSSLFHDIEIMENQDLSVHAQVFVPLSGRCEASGPNTLTNPQFEPPVLQTNVPLASNTNVNQGDSSSLDSLITLMEQSMRNTREEFRKELSSIRDSISRIGISNQPNTFKPQDFLNNHNPSDIPPPSGNRSSNTQVNTENNIKLEKWKISYDGVGSVSDFLFKVETLCARTKCSDEHLLSNFHVLLEGKAENWYWLFTRQNSNITFPMLRHALKKQFGHLESDHDILLKMSSRKQQLKESYDDFHTAIISMNTRLLNPLPDTTVIEILKKNINTNLQFLLFNAEPRDINQFRDTARKAEKVIKENKSQSSSGLTRHVNEIEVLPLESDDYEAHDPQIEALNFIQRKTNYDFSKIQCWNCSSYGHSYIYCSEEIKTPFCFKCGNKGFLTPKCPNNHRQGNRKMGELATGDTRPFPKTPSSN